MLNRFFFHSICSLPYAKSTHVVFFQISAKGLDTAMLHFDWFLQKPNP